MVSPNVLNATSINFVLMARFHSYVPVAVLRDALNRLRGRQKAFDFGNSYNILTPHPQVTGAYPLCVLLNCNEDDWQEVAARELAQPFRPSDPRVRFVLLERDQTSDLLVVCDHGVSDGLSGTLLLRDLLELLNLPEQQLLPMPVPPPLWEVLPSFVYRNLPNKLCMAILVALLDLLDWNKARRKITHPVPAFQINSAELPTDITAALVERCRVEQTSVHAAICTAWLLALDNSDSDEYVSNPARRGKSRSMHSVSSPVNMRKWLAPEMRESAGLYYTTVTTSVRCDRTRGFWNIAREIKQKMNHAEKEPSFYLTPLFLQSMYKRLSNMPEGATFHMPEPPVTYDYSISNLGRVECHYVFSNIQDARYSIEALYGPMVNAFHGEKTVGVCTLGGQMRFVFTTFADEMNLNKARELTRGAMKLLEAAVRVQGTI